MLWIYMANNILCTCMAVIEIKIITFLDKFINCILDYHNLWAAITPTQIQQQQNNITILLILLTHIHT
jgi:hypothetical protein